MKPRLRYRFLQCLCSAPVLLLGTLSTASLAEELPVWELGLGVGALALPDYLGSDEEQFYAAPLPWFVYRGERFRADRNGLQGLFYTGDGIRLDLSFSGSVPVDSDDNASRRGMDDLDPGFEVGPSLNIDLLRGPRHNIEALIRARALFALDGTRARHEGWIFNPVLEWGLQQSPSTRWEFSLRGYYGDDDYHHFYYGVDPAFATAQRPAYRGEGGYGGVAARISLNSDLNADWALLASLGWNDIHDAAFDDSPLVEQNHGIYFNIFLIRTLYRSTRTTGEYEE